MAGAGAFSRVLATAARGMGRRSFRASSPSTPEPTSPASAAAIHPLLTRLLQEEESGVKVALDREEGLPRLCGHAFFWEPLLSALRASSPGKADLVLEWKLERLLKEDVRVHDGYSRLILLGGKLGNIEYAERVFTSMEAQGIRSNTAVFNSLISACFWTGNTVMALTLFEIMERSDSCKPDLATYNLFVSMYSKMGDCNRMLGWHYAGVAAGFAPELQTYECLIRGLVKSSRFDEAERFYEEMISYGITANVVILECILEGLCKQRKLERVKEFLNLLTDGGWRMTETMTEKLLRLYLDFGLVDEMEELLALVDDQSGLAVLSRLHSGIIRLHAMDDRLDDMEYAVKRLLRKGLLFTCSGDIEAVICSYFRRDAYGRLDFFLDQIRDSHDLTKTTYDILVAGYRRAGRRQHLDVLIKEMQKKGLL